MWAYRSKAFKSSNGLQPDASPVTFVLLITHLPVFPITAIKRPRTYKRIGSEMIEQLHSYQNQGRHEVEVLWRGTRGRVKKNLPKSQR